MGNLAAHWGAAANLNVLVLPCRNDGSWACTVVRCAMILERPRQEHWVHFWWHQGKTGLDAWEESNRKHLWCGVRWTRECLEYRFRFYPTLFSDEGIEYFGVAAPPVRPIPLSRSEWATLLLVEPPVEYYWQSVIMLLTYLKSKIKVNLPLVSNK